MTDPAGWQPDPSGTHDHRYWDGQQWTDHVADAGVASTDPYVPAGSDVLPDDATAVTSTTATDATDATDSYPTTTATPYVPPTPVPSGDRGDPSKRNLLIGGAILAAVAIAVIAFLALRDDDGGDDLAGQDTSVTEDTDESADLGSPGGDDLDALAAACEDGDFAACDELYFQSDFGSDLEELATTCGGVTEGQVGTCEATNGGGDELEPGAGLGDDLGDLDSQEDLARFYEEALGLTAEQADCLAERLFEVFDEGELDPDQPVTEYLDFFEECDISLEELGAN